MRQPENRSHQAYSRREIILSGAYRHLAEQYSSAILPGCVRKSKDKSSVENTMGKFSSLGSLRASVYRQVAAYNAQPFQKHAGSRQGEFTEKEQPLLRDLPAVPYKISTWVTGRKVAKNSYVTWKKNFYFVPLKHVGENVGLRITSTVLEVYLQSQRLRNHPIFPSTMVNHYRTNDADIPPERKYRACDANRLRGWAHRIGPNTLEVTDKISISVPVTEQGISPALAVLRLSSKYGAQRLENDCFVALQSRPSLRVTGICIRSCSINKTTTGKKPPSRQVQKSSGCVRGSDYYARKNS